MEQSETTRLLDTSKNRPEYGLTINEESTDPTLDQLSPDTVECMTPRDQTAWRWMIGLCMHLSLIANVVLCAAKIYALITSRSLSLIASLLDTALDLLSQFLLFFSESNFRQYDNNFPVGKTRLTPVSILICSVLMFAGAIEVIQESVVSLIDKKRELSFDFPTVLILIIAIIIKAGLYFLCRYSSVASHPGVETLGDDHRNDVLTNTCALIFGWIAFHRPQFWWLDPIGGCIISLYIAYSWVDSGLSQMNKLVGRKADEEQVTHIKNIIVCYEEVEEEIKRVKLDWLRAYYLGELVVVELEIIMDASAPLKITHDVSLSLQQAIEKLQFVERAFVHVDYRHRDHDEHKSFFELPN